MPLSRSSLSSTQTAQEIRCRYCDMYLCEGSKLRRQGTTVVCSDPAFEQLVRPQQSPGGN